MLKERKNDRGTERVGTGGGETGAILCFSATSLLRGMTDRCVSRVKEAQWAAVRHSMTMPFSLHCSPSPVKNSVGAGRPFTTEMWQRKQTQSRLAWGTGGRERERERGLLISGLSVSQILLALPWFSCQKEQTFLRGEIKQNQATARLQICNRFIKFIPNLTCI